MVEVTKYETKNGLTHKKEKTRDQKATSAAAGSTKEESNKNKEVSK